MSYFVCGFKTKAETNRDLDQILRTMVPPHLPNDPLLISDEPFLVSYGHRKAIPHLSIRDPQTGSWLVMLGTPLVRLGSDRDRLALLATFLESPAESLRNVLDGNFAAFAYDGPRDRLISATDLNNTTPVFYAAVAGGMLFSSHELALARLLRPEIDPVGFAQAIQLGVTWDSRTRFRNISKLRPCEALTAERDGRARLERYWTPRDERVWSGTSEDQIERWGALLSESVRKIYEAAGRRPVIADFTAGEDSRLVVAQCHALGIPFAAHVKGKPGDLDVVVAEQGARKVGFELVKRRKGDVDHERFLARGQEISLRNDGYLDFFSACSDYAADVTEPLDDYGVVKYNGFPGGEAFRGSYYLRGKAAFPSATKPLDYRFFTRMKYLLDYYPGLFRYPDGEFMEGIHQLVAESLQDVADYPIGTQIDHVLRVFQSCCVGLKYKDPLYLPLATGPMTRSIYGLPPRLKQGGRLTRACTEKLFPELAFVRTQSGVPSVRKTLWRLPMFLPEYLAFARKVSRGAVSRLFKWTPTSDTNQGVGTFTALVRQPPYREWFASSTSMITGPVFDAAALDALLTRAKAGSCRHVATLGRIVSHELAFRWVYENGEGP